MPLSTVEASETLGLPRVSAAVCVPVYGAADDFTQCIRALLAHTPLDVPMLIADDASADPAIRAFLDDLDARGVLEHHVTYLRQPENLGFVGNMNSAFAVLDPADVVIVNSDCVVAAEWFTRLRAAATSDSRVATASTLTNNGTILSIPSRNRPSSNLPQDWPLDRAAEQVAAQSLKLHPQIPTGIGHCLYVRRAALDLVGDFDRAFDPGYGEEVDFSQRCVIHGLSHVVADDVLVLHRGGASFSPGREKNPEQEEHDEIISARYRYYDDWVDAVKDDRTSPLARSLAAASRALRGLTVTIDGRSLGPFVTGTQTHTLEVIRAVHATSRCVVRVVVPDQLGDYAAARIAELPGIELLAESDVGDDLERTDVVHRPFQVTHEDDLDFLLRVGERMVVTHQDLIAFNNPSYFDSFRAWDEHRRLTRRTMAIADRVVFFSAHAAAEALAADLVDRPRVEVVHIGTTHAANGASPATAPPPGLRESIGERPFLLCLGTDFSHKNRVFALHLLERLRVAHGWDGGLVFAGGHVARGSSAGAEASFLAARPDLAGSVVDLKAVPDAERDWLMASSAAVVYPTTYEGFGLVPYEAASAGVPCVFASGTSLAELLPDSLATIEPWDADATAEAVVPLLTQGAKREEHVAAVAAAGARLTWQRTGEALVGAYETAARSPARESAVLLLETHAAEERMRELERDYWDLEEAFDDDAAALVGPRGVLPKDLIRPLLAISSRPWLRIPLLGPLRLAFGFVRWVKTFGHRPAS